MKTRRYVAAENLCRGHVLITDEGLRKVVKAKQQADPLHNTVEIESVCIVTGKSTFTYTHRKSQYPTTKLPIRSR